MKKLIVLPFLICITSVFSQTLRESDLERGSDIKGKYTAFETLESDRLEVGDKIEFINYYSRTFSICKGSNDLKKLDLDITNSEYNQLTISKVGYKGALMSAFDAYAYINADNEVLSCKFYLPRAILNSEFTLVGKTPIFLERNVPKEVKLLKVDEIEPLNKTDNESSKNVQLVKQSSQQQSTSVEIEVNNNTQTQSSNAEYTLKELETKCNDLERRVYSLTTLQSQLKSNVYNASDHIKLAGEYKKESLNSSIIGSALIGLGAYVSIRNISGSSSSFNPTPFVLNVGGAAFFINSIVKQYKMARELESFERVIKKM